MARESLFSASFRLRLEWLRYGIWRRMPFATFKRIEEIRTRPPSPPRDPLWADFQDAELRADGERLADIGDQVIAGVPIHLFNITENERLFVDAYIAAREARADG